MVSKDTFVEEEYSLSETHLDESFVKQLVEVIPHDLELHDLVSNECPLKPIPTCIAFPYDHYFTLLYIL